MKIDNSRQAAFSTLLHIEKDSAYTNLALNSALDSNKLDARDSAFCSALIYGVAERQITLDWLLSNQLQKPIKQLRPPVLIALRMGVYQLFFMDSVPASAAVNTTVQLLKSNGCAYASGLANAVLRKCSAARLNFPKRNEPNYFSVTYSVQPWLVDMWIDAYGQSNAEELLKASLQNSESYIRVNTAKTTREGLIAKLADESIEATQSSILPNAAILPKGIAPQKTKSFVNGLYHAQGLASQYCVAALNPKPGERVLDICAAPGGKTFTIAQELLSSNSHTANGNIVSLELHEHRAELIRKGALRLGLDNITVRTADSSKIRTDELGMFDAVLCDAPCSGLGTLGKKPDIRRKTSESLDNLPEIQYTLLISAAGFVRRGGRLVYSTCTLNPAENEDICSRFLAENPEFKADTKFLPQLVRTNPDSSFLSLFPHIHFCDGFFIALFTKG